MDRSVVATLLLIGLAVTVSQSPSPSVTPPSPPLAPFGKLPVYFVRNNGQLPPPVAYYIQGRNTSVYFSPDSVTYSLRKPTARPRSPFRDAAFVPDEPTVAWTVRLDFLHANPSPVIEAVQPTQATVSYFRGAPDQWRTAIPTYGAIVYKQVWPGIDVEFAGPEGNLKYTFLVHPGADPKQIRFAYRGASSITLATDGRLDIVTPASSFSDDKPVVWQDAASGRQSVHAAFFLRGEEVRFDVGAYDPSRTLSIDPVILIYSGFLGGSNSDGGTGVAVDAAGNAYVIGHTYSTDFPTAAGLDATQNGDSDVFVAKVNSSGTALVYSGFLGGSRFDLGLGIAVDGAGNAYITGYTWSSNFPTKIGPDTTFNGGNYDAFVAKIDSSGTALVYSGFLGGSSLDSGHAIAVDLSGNAYVTGRAGSSNFPATVGPDTTHKGDDAFVAKVNPSGAALVYCGFLGGSGFEVGLGIAVDAAGNAYVTGVTTPTDFPTTVGPDPTHNGDYDAFIAKINSSGTALIYAGFLGGSGSDSGHAIAIDAAGNAYVAGRTQSSNFPTTVGPDTTFNGSFDAFVAKVNPSGTALVYSGFLGGARGDDGAEGIAVDAVGNAYVTGTAGSANFPTNVGPDTTHNGDYEAFVAKVNSSGTALIYSGFLGGSISDAGQQIAVDAVGNAYVIGGTNSLSFPTIVGPDTTHNGVFDAFITKLAAFPGTAGPTLAFRNLYGALETSTFPTPDLRRAGGVFASDPAIAITPAGRAFFVARDTATPTFGSLYLNWLQPDNIYAAWQFLGGTFQGTPAITTVGETAFITARDQWGAYWTTTYTPGSSPNPWTFLGGVLDSSPSMASCRDGSVYVAGRDASGAIWTRRWDSASSSWRDWHSLGGITKGKPSVACGADNAAYISTRDAYNYNPLWLARVFQESPATWHPGDGVLHDDTQIVANGTNLHVFALSYSVAWYRTWQIGTGWQPWTQIGGVLTHMSPALYGGNLFLAGQDGAGNVWWWNGLSNSWTNHGKKDTAPGARFSTAYR